MCITQVCPSQTQIEVCPFERWQDQTSSCCETRSSKAGPMLPGLPVANSMQYLTRLCMYHPVKESWLEPVTYSLDFTIVSTSPVYLHNTVDGSHLLEVVTNNKSRTLIEAVYMKHTVTLVMDSSHYIQIFISNRAGKFYVTLFSNQKLVLNARLSRSRSRKRLRFGISFAILASFSTSSTASAIVVVVNSLLSKVAMAVVFLSSVAAFF